MGRKLVQETNLQNIAAAIRAKNGGSSTYKPREMADAIRTLPSAGTLVPKAITENGSYSPQSENADGYSSVTVNVGRYWGGKTITRNGNFRAANDHVGGYSSVSVNVPNSYNALDEGKVVSGGALTAQTSLSVTQNGTFDTTRNNQVTVNISNDTTLVSKAITANGTYLASDDNADGFNWVNVAVPGGFEASDEGKVIQNGALMPQSSLTVTANGTYDTTAKNSIIVNVSSAGHLLDFNALPLTYYTPCSYRATLSLNYRRSLSLNCSTTCPSSGFQMPGVIPRHLEISRLLPVTAFRFQRCTEPYGHPPAASAAEMRTSGSCRTVG